MARLPIPVETRRRLNEDDRRWPIKLGLRALAIPFAFIAMVLFAVATSLSKQNYGGNDWTDGLPLAPVSWNVISRLCCAPTLTYNPSRMRLSKPFEIPSHPSPSVLTLYSAA